MIYIYAKELQGNTDKYVMKYISELVKLSVEKDLITLDDLYSRDEAEICRIFAQNFSSWKKFNRASILSKSSEEPQNRFYISFETKKRNTVPLVEVENKVLRIDLASPVAKDLYDELKSYKDAEYAYVDEIIKLE